MSPLISDRSPSRAGQRALILTPTIIVVAALLHAGLAPAQSRVEDSAKDAAYECAVPGDAAALQAKVEQLYPKKSDRNALGCAADLLFMAAQASPEDPQLNVQALLVESEYIDHVNTLWDFDIYGVRQPEWSARLSHAVPQGKALAEQVARLAPEDPTAECARAYFQVVWPFKSADAKTALMSSRDAIPLLEKATAKQPNALDGNCLLILGRLYYEVPEFAGGDMDKAAATLDAATQVAPDNFGVWRYLAYVRLQAGDADGAKKALAQMLGMEPSPLDLQLMADELKNARDLAHRIPAADLETQLTAKRDALLKAHPELLTRASSAANMHGGVDPMTGKSYD
jgi:tetratricopeptide (TPR) repeat protein